MATEPRIVAVTGAHGFVGRNLCLRLRERGFVVREVVRGTATAERRAMLAEADIVFHLAGANRPADPNAFAAINRDFTAEVVADIAAGGRVPLVVHVSSARAGDDSAYGRSKRDGEAAMLALGGAARVAVFRPPNIFGKWARPDYNSAVATFCHNIARGLPIRLDDPAAPLALVHVDDLIDQWLELIDTPPAESGTHPTRNVHETTVGQVAETIRAFADMRAAGGVGAVGIGLTRALYATYVAALPEAAFSYPLTAHCDARGTFTEMLRTPDAGQVSTFTAHPGVTRGGHYHHAKVEKFLIVHGTARFRFRHLLTDARHELTTSGGTPVVVETIPGWAHDVTNVGDDLLVALLWANEAFDPARPDTMGYAL